MMIRLVRTTLFGLLAGFAASCGAAQAQVSNNCAVYFDAVTASSKEAVPVVPDKLLANWSSALPCLVKIIESLKDQVTGSALNPDARSKMLSATAAFRSIVTKLNVSDQAAGNSSGLDEFIKQFRLADNLDVVSVLSYGARSDVYDIRLNSVLLLGNVIDNTSVCVPLAHLNDPTLMTSANGMNGRANLLGIISVVAPWAYKQNFENIEKTRDFINTQIANDNNAKATSNLIENIRVRLKSQNTDSNRNVDLPQQWRIACKGYIEKFVPKLPSLDNLQY
jgi:hypothetical protein